MEIPTLSEEEKQKTFTEMWFGTMVGSMDFIMRKLGPEAMKKLNDETTNWCAADMKARGVDNPLKFAVDYAVVNKNIFDGNVEISGNSERAILDVKRRSNLEVALKFAEKEMLITKEHYCGGCVNGYFKRVAENLDFNIGVEFTKKRSNITISK
ncbi:MAG: hypothetical protein QMD06_04040 [Candidatus Altarchaeum sp.]|nr:hypothetical protein [Candidatus Altarchaeum sp.]